MPSKYKPTRDRKQRRVPKKTPRNAEDNISEAAPPPPPAAVPSDPNAEIIIPLTKEQKAGKRKADLLAEARAENPGMSGKKLKRFNKYIVTYAPPPPLPTALSISGTILIGGYRRINSRKRRKPR